MLNATQPKALFYLHGLWSLWGKLTEAKALCTWLHLVFSKGSPGNGHTSTHSGSWDRALGAEGVRSVSRVQVSCADHSTLYGLSGKGKNRSQILSPLLPSWRLQTSKLDSLKPPFLVCQSGRIVLAFCSCLGG